MPEVPKFPADYENVPEAECGCRWDLNLKKMLEICPGHKALLRLDHPSTTHEIGRTLAVWVTDLEDASPQPKKEHDPSCELVQGYPEAKCTC